MAVLALVEDDPALRLLLTEILGRGHQVYALPDGAALTWLMADGTLPDLCLLDRSLPGEDGLAIARRLRTGPAGQGMGIIMLTGADAPDQRIEGLEDGADDYVTKPFSPADLTARVEAVLRRRRERAHLAFGPFALDRRQWRLTDGGGRVLDLSPTEVDLVAAFASHPDRPLGRDDILRLAPARDDPLDRSIDSRIGRLRRKLEAAGLPRGAIRTLRGKGYLYSTR